MKLDAVDRRILRQLQRDATQSLAELADSAGISQTACWRRIKRLEQDEVIQRRVTLLSHQALGLGLIGFVMIRTSNHSDAWLEKFAAGVRAIPEIIEFHRMAGDVDYLLKIVAPDIAGYDAIYKKMIKVAELSDVSASFSMEQIKYTTELPLEVI